MAARRVPAAPTLALLAALCLSLLAAAPGGPIHVDPAFASAPDGRLVVTWRDAPLAVTEVPGAAEIRTSQADSHRSVVVAKPGRAADVAARLARDPGVASVVPDAVVTVTDWPADTAPDDAYYADYQNDMRVIGMPAAWTFSTGAPSVVVAVLDTGYEGSHPDLAAIPTVFPWNARTGSQNVTDGYGHGTHVAGTIAGQTNNAIGVAGIAPDVTIMPVKVMDENGQGYWSDFLEGVDWARIHGASVVNLSLGGVLSASQASAWQPVFDAAYEAGMVVIAAAGNNDADLAFYPASFNHVISVAATTNNDNKASFSNYGPAVDVSAPGNNITSTFKDATYRTMSGTSMATPHVVGVAALMRSLHPDYDVDDVEAGLKLTARDLGEAGRDDIFGAGRIQADEAVQWVAPDDAPPIASLVAPLNGAINVAESVDPVVAFNEAVVGADGAAIVLKDGAGHVVPATVSYAEAGSRATITPATRLASRTAYKVWLSGAVEDLAGNALAPTTFAFTTGDSLDPTITGVHPSNGATGVARGVTVKLWFSEAVTGVSKVTLKLRDLKRDHVVLVTVRYDAVTRTATIDPATRLPGRTWFKLKVKSGIEDKAGRDLARRSFTFKTRA